MKRCALAVLFCVLVLYVAAPASAQEIAGTATAPAMKAVDSNEPASLGVAPAGKARNFARSKQAATKDTDTNESKLNFFGGYAYLSNGFGGRASNHGWNAELTYNLSHNVGLTADFSGHSASTNTTSTFVTGSVVAPLQATTTIRNDLDQDFYYFVFGPKLTHHADKFELYAHFLVGFAHGRFSSTTLDSTGTVIFTTGQKDTNFAFVPGAGVDWMATEHWGWRILEGDYLYTTLGTNGFQGTQHNIRISTGVIFRW
jgi:opacity protein-like surface antigen